MSQNLKLMVIALLVFLISMSVGMLVNSTMTPRVRKSIEYAELQNNLILVPKGVLLEEEREKEGP